MAVTEAELEQRRRNVRAIAKKRRGAAECKRGHSNWRVRPNGQRECITCQGDHTWYWRRGLKLA